MSQQYARTSSPTSIYMYYYLCGHSTSAFAVVLRGIVSPCRWREFVEPATPKNPIEATQIHIECAFRGCPRSLQDASVKHILRELYWVTMVEEHALMATRRVAQNSL